MGGANGITSRLKQFVIDCSSKYIFNAEEISLKYSAMPTKAFAIKKLLLCAIIKGEKEDLLIIVNSKNPRCFQAAHVDKFLLEWVYSKIARMTINVMTALLLKFNNKIEKLCYF